MATGVAITGAVIGGAGAIKQKKAAKKTAAATEKLEQENIELEKAETAESIRRAEEANLKNLGMAKTQAGASGFGVGSSMDAYVKRLKATQEADVEWMKTSGASRAEISARESAARKRASDRYAAAEFAGNIGRSMSNLSAFNW